MEDRYDRTFKALGHPIRRRILDALRDRPLTTGMLVERISELDRCTVMQHLGVLEGAGLVIAVRKGRERWNHIDATPIAEIHERWIGPFAALQAAGLLRFKRALEGGSDEPSPEVEVVKTKR